MLRAVMEKDQDIKIGINTDNVIVEGVTKEEDPSVPSWAKRPNKPDYTAEEVGALPENTFIPNKLSDLEEDTNHRTVTDDEKDKWNEGTKDYNDLINKPTKLSEFQNDEGFITGYNETDPTVPGWAKRPNKPEYTAEEVGALPDTATIPTTLSELSGDSEHRTVTDEQIKKWNNGGGTLDYNDLINKPTKLSEFQNDEGFITGYNETDPTVPGWAKRPNKPEYTAEEVGALPDTTKIPVNASELNNDAGYITEEDMEAVTTADIDKMWEGTY